VATSGVYASKKIYVVGQADIFSYNTCLIYDPVLDSWSNGAPLPTARGLLGLAVVEDLIYAIGGTGINYLEPPVAVNERYTPPDYHTPNTTTPTTTPTLMSTFTATPIQTQTFTPKPSPDQTTTQTPTPTQTTPTPTLQLSIPPTQPSTLPLLPSFATQTATQTQNPNPNSNTTTYTIIIATVAVADILGVAALSLKKRRKSQIQ
jgi:hypothetical protein